MTKIAIKGTVIPNDVKDIYDWMGYDSVSPKDVNNQLNEAGGQDVTLEINSPGGYVDAGSEIYTALKQYPGKVTANIVGNACSSASWIAMAASHINISPTAQMFIHRTQGGASGNSDDLASCLQGLDSMDRALVDVYAEHTGKSKQDIYNLMSNETWMNAKDAVANGFADEIMFENQTVTNANNLAIPTNMVNKLKQALKSSDDLKPTQENIEEKKEPVRKKNMAHFLWN